jgi:hypothetical protein
MGEITEVVSPGRSPPQPLSCGDPQPRSGGDPARISGAPQLEQYLAPSGFGLLHREQ